MRLFGEHAESKEFTTPARTITETDVVQFSGLTGDYNPIHTDAEFAAGTRYGQRIVHGLFGVSVCIGLMSRTGIFEGSAVALLGVDEWHFRAPIFIGDTVRCRIHILGKRLTSSGETGVVQRPIGAAEPAGRHRPRRPHGRHGLRVCTRGFCCWGRRINRLGCELMARITRTTVCPDPRDLHLGRRGASRSAALAE